METSEFKKTNPIELEDVLNLEKIGFDSKFAISAKNNLVAYEVGRPISESFTGTNSFGTQNNETDIYVADLVSGLGSKRLIPQTSIHRNQAPQTYCPAWSLEGTYLAFILVEHNGSIGESSYKVEYHVAAYSLDRGTVGKLARVPPVCRVFGGEIFRWISDSEILITHANLDDSSSSLLSFDALLNPVESALNKVKSARSNRKATSFTLDSKNGVEYTGRCSTIDSRISLYNLHCKEKPVWSKNLNAFDTSSYFLLSPNLDFYITPRLDKSFTLRLRDSFFGKFELGDVKSTLPANILDISPYQANFTNILWSRDSGTIWMKVLNHDESYSCIGKIDFKSGKFKAYNYLRFDSDNAGNFQDEVMLCHDDLVFSTQVLNADATARLEWYQFNTLDYVYTNLSSEDENVADWLFHFDEGVFIGGVGENLYRYNYFSNTSKSEKIMLGIEGEDIDVNYRMLFPRPNAYNSKIRSAPFSGVKHCLVRKTEGERFDYYISRDGLKFSRLDIPSTTRLVASATTDDNRFKIIGLDSSKTGSSVIGFSEKNKTTLSYFNKHLKEKKQSVTKFFSVGDGDARIFCEMLFPVGAGPNSEFDTIISIYPGVQYHPRNEIYAHNASEPPCFNPHIFSGKGYGVLKIGLPILDDNIKTNGVFEEYVRIVDIAIACAASKNYIDCSRLHIHGHSWGAYAATGIISKSSQFLTCIGLSGPYNPIGQYGVFEQGLEEQLAGRVPESCYVMGNIVSSRTHPWADKDRYANSSPLLLAQDIKTPTLLIHGEMDSLVRVTHAQQLYTALFLQNKEVRLSTYGGEGHLISSRPNLVHMWKTIFDYLSIGKN